jgi:arylsulfatase A-like enzyme
MGPSSLTTGLLAAVAALAASSCAPPQAASTGPERAIVLFLVDTLRADRLSTYGHDRPTSPNLDRLAARGVVFERTWAAAPWTLPSTASLLTGLDAANHGAGLWGDWRDLDTQLPDGLAPEVPTIAERLTDAGWRCEAFVTNPFVGFGLERGFESFRLEQTEGADVVRYGLERLAQADARPLFLLLHLMDVHDPLLVPDEDVRATEPDRWEVPLWARTFEMLAELPEHRDARLELYDGAVHYADRQLGVLLEGIEDLGLAERTLVAFTSDHGEEVFESSALQRTAGYRRPEGTRAVGHGHTLFEEVLRVPLVIGGAGLEQVAGRRVAALVAGHDLAPTLLQLAGVDYDADALDARSLQPWLEGREAPPRAVFSTGIAYGPPRTALVRDEWQLVRGADGERTLLLEIGDATRSDRSGERPELATELESDLAVIERRVSARAGVPLVLSDEERARLRAIGYLSDDSD